MNRVRFLSKITNPANPLIMLIMVLTMAFTFGCSDDKGDDDQSSSSVTDGGSSSSVTTIGGNSSSAGGGISSSSEVSGYTGEYGSLSYEDKTYKTVVIGTQTWMAENLNYDAEGSRCYDDNEDNCGKYGRLYDWETAMIVCPSDWHLPSDDDLYKLVDYVGGEEVAGKHLKATSGWGEDGNGLDTYGFAALPGGYWWREMYDSGFGYGGNWWTATEYDSEAYSAVIGHDDSAADNITPKFFLYSVRCIKD